jgi:long-chain fatty acid transport protein
MLNQCGKYLNLYVVVIIVAVYGIIEPLSHSQALEQRVEIPSSINPVGSGARALGMGGAFIAVADDATAASWNPGGLVQLEKPEISIVGAFYQREEDITFGDSPSSSGREKVDASRFNYLSAAYPFTVLNRNMVMAINYQNLYDFNRTWQFPFSLSASDSEPADIEIEQKGSLGAIGVAYCVQITPRLSLGLTLNIWEDSIYENGWNEKQKTSGTQLIAGDLFHYNAELEDRYKFNGLNANIGIVYRVNSKLTFGFIFKSPFTADLKHETSDKIEFPGLDIETQTSYEFDEKLDMPMSYGIGLAYRFSDKLTVAIDIYRTEWDDFLLEDDDGNVTSPINDKPKNKANIDPTNQVRTGCEYLSIGDNYIIPIRGGLFYDPAPAEDTPDDYFGFSLGSGYARGSFIFDLAYQYRFGNDVAKHLNEGLDFSQDIQEHTVFTSLIYHF